MRNLFTSFLSTGAIQIANLVTGILAARLLLPEGRGELALLLLWPILIAELGSLGLNTAVSYKSARRETTSPEIFSATVWLVAALSPLLIGAYAAAVLFAFDGQRPAVVSMAWVCAAIVPLHLYSLALVSQFQGEQRFGPFNVLRSLMHFFYLGLVLLLVALSLADVQGFAFAFLGAIAATGAVAVGMAARLGWLSLVPDTRMMLDMLRYGVRVHVGNMLNIATRKLDQLLISLTLAVSDLGLYVIAVTIAGIPMIVTATTDLIAFPKMAQQDSDEGRQFVLGRYLRATMFLVGPCVAVLILAAPEVIALLFGAAFLPAADIARLLLLSGIAFVFRTLFASYLRAGNRMMIVSKVEAAGLILTVAALALLVPLYGLVGAAAAQLVSVTLPVFWCVALIRRVQPFDIVALLTPRRADLDVFREALARRRAGA